MRSSGPDRAHLDPRAARQGRRWGGHAPVHAAPGRLLGAGQGRADHQGIGAGGDRLGELATASHAAVGDDRHVASGLGEVRVPGSRHIADRGDLRDPDAEHLAGRARGAGPDPDEHGGRALLHQRERGLGVGRVADRDRDGHVANEGFERERVVLGGQVAGAADLALDEEQVGAVLGAERPERASRARGRGDRRLRARGVDLVESPGDEVLAHRLQVGLGEEGLDVGIRRRGDLAEQLVRVVVAGLDALEIEDRETAESPELPGEPGIDDGVHGGREDRDGEIDAGERLGQVDIGRFDRVRAGGERDVLEAVRRADRVHLRMEDAALGRRAEIRLRSVDHVALLCRLTVGCCCPESTRGTRHHRGLRWPSRSSSNQVARPDPRGRRGSARWRSR